MTRRNPFLVIIGVLTVLYVTMAVFLPIEWLRLLAGALTTGFALAAATLWLPDAVRLIREGRATTGTAYIGTYSIVFNTLGRPDWMAILPIYALGQLILAFGNFLLTANPSKPEPAFHSISAWAIAIGVLAGVAVGFFLGISFEI